MPEHRERAEYTAKHEEKASTLLFPTACMLDWVSMPGISQYENLFFHGNTNAPWTFYTPHTAQSQQTKQSPHQGAARQNLTERIPLKQKQQQQKVFTLIYYEAVCIQDAIHYRCQNRASHAQIRLYQDKVGRLNALCTAPATKQCLPKNTSERYKSVTALFVRTPWQQEEFRQSAHSTCYLKSYIPIS